MKVRWPSTLALGVILASSAAGCAARLPREAAVQMTAEPLRCGPNRIGAGWPELRASIAPVSFCVPPELQLVRGPVHLATSRKLLPYPQARSREEASETWKTHDGHRIIETSLYEGPDEPRGWARGATELREATVGAGCTGGTAPLRQYRVPAVWNRPAPGTDRRADSYDAYLELPLGPMQRFTLHAVARDTVERAKLISVLRSACTVDR